LDFRLLVTEAGSFIGHRLVKHLVNIGYWVQGVDVKYPEYELSPAHEFELLDLRRFDNCLIATRGRRGVPSRGCYELSQEWLANAGNG
jgi:GDP-D-mannose 3', 5'-epimerase